MLNKAVSKIRSDQQAILIWGLGVLVLLCLFTAVASGWYIIAGVPAFFLLIYTTLVDFRLMFYILLACIPLSTEILLPNGLGTDLPTEPLIVGLLIVGLLVFIRQAKQTDTRFLLHPITLLLLLHLGWTFFTMLTSQLMIVSVKFFLAKTWYIGVFYFLAAYILKTIGDFRRFFWVIFLPLLFTVLVILVRHSGYGFSYKDVYQVLHPFQRNHVNYAATLALFLPFVWFVWNWQPKYSRKWLFLGACLALLFAAVYLSYTRAAYISLGIAVAAYFVIRLQLLRYVLLGAFIAVIVGLVYITRANKYLDYAPNYDQTVSHYEFDDLIEATYNMEDISTMERLYRWVAGFHMSAAEPWVGFGPGNFVNFYKSFTVSSFQTYVSSNEEKSGIHAYFLMVLVEQGMIGLLIFLLLCTVVLLTGERVYHQAQSKKNKQMVMALLLSIVVIDSFLLINDLIETDKIGSFFFMNMAMLVNADLLNKTQASSSGQPDAQKNQSDSQD